MARSRRDGAPRTRSDAYVGLLLLSLLAQIVGAVFLYLDWSQYPSTKPPAPPSISAAPAPGGGPGPAAPGGPGGPGPAGGQQVGVPGGMTGVPPGGMMGVPPGGPPRP